MGRLDETSVFVRALEIPLAIDAAVVLSEGLVELDTHPQTLLEVSFPEELDGPSSCRICTFTAVARGSSLAPAAKNFECQLTKTSI